jgi:hypothetical protein
MAWGRGSVVMMWYEETSTLKLKRDTQTKKIDQDVVMWSLDYPHSIVKVKSFIKEHNVWAAGLTTRQTRQS